MRQFFMDSAYKTPRMASEYGLQSYPSFETLEAVYEENDMYYESKLNGHRQHHGNGKILWEWVGSSDSMIASSDFKHHF